MFSEERIQKTDEEKMSCAVRTALVIDKTVACPAGTHLRLFLDHAGLSAQRAGEEIRFPVTAAENTAPGGLSAAALRDILSDENAEELWFHVTQRSETGARAVCLGTCTLLPRTNENGSAGAETAICGGSNIKAPMRLDFIRRLRETPKKDWPQVLICRDESVSSQPLCFASQEESSDPMNCVGLVASPSDALTTLLRAGTVRGTVRSLCAKDGEPCAPDSPEAWGFLAEYSVENKSRGVLDEAVRQACREGRGGFALLCAKAAYLSEQAVPESIILRTLAAVTGDPVCPEMIPDPPVRFAQSDAYGELTRCLAYRLCGMNLRLVGNKGCGKNTLMQSVDWVLGVPQYRMQGNAELDKLDLLGGPTIENGTMRYQLSDMLVYLRDGADVVLDEGNTIKPECADVLHSLTDEARQIEVPGYGLVKMHPISSFTITMNEDYAGTNFMNEATIDRFTPIQMSQPESVVEILRRVVPEAPDRSLRICDALYCTIRDMIRSAEGLEPEAMTIRGFIDALRAEPLLGLRLGLIDNVANKPQDAYTRLQLTALIESMIR